MINRISVFEEIVIEIKEQLSCCIILIVHRDCVGTYKIVQLRVETVTKLLITI